jgi:hypothetical protein
MLTVALAPPPDFTQFRVASIAATAISFKDDHAAQPTRLGLGFGLGLGLGLQGSGGALRLAVEDARHLNHRAEKLHCWLRLYRVDCVRERERKQKFQFFKGSTLKPGSKRRENKGPAFGAKIWSH